MLGSQEQQAASVLAASQDEAPEESQPLSGRIRGRDGVFKRVGWESPGGARPKGVRLSAVEWGYDGVRSISI